MKTGNELTLQEVYKIFSEYWTNEHRLWVLTNQQVNYNIILSRNDFLHFCQIDKIIKLKNFNTKRKNNYIRNRIGSQKMTFASIEKSLRNINSHKHFELKKKALICLALCMKEQKLIFHKICFTSNAMFANVKPDYVLINEENKDRCLLLCNFIEKTNPKYLENLSHVKSLMYCNHNHPRFRDFSKFSFVEIEMAKIIKRKRSK